ncbi:MAG TPA: hypothetical protein VKV77_04245 [Methylovirgula sp.]|nr:hypothetical protein [Methylovirgula sp.]
MEKVFYQTRPKGRAREYERWTLFTDAAGAHVKHEVVIYNETLALEPFTPTTDICEVEHFLSSDQDSRAKDELRKILAEMKPDPK